MSDANQEQSETPTTPTAEATPVVETPTQAVETPTPEAPAPEPTNTTPEQPVTPTSGPKVSGEDAYQKALNAALGNAPEVPEPQPSGETPAAEEPTTETPEPTATETPENQEPTPEETQTPEGRKEFRPRLSSLDDRQKEAILLAKQLKDEGKPISLAEAEKRINAKYGESVSETPTQEQTPAAPVRTPDLIQAEIDAAKVEAKKHAENLDSVAQQEANEKIMDLKVEKMKAEQEQARRASTEEARFSQAVEQSRAQAQEVYPVSAQENHPINAKATEIWNNLRKLQDPLIFNPNAPFKVYQMAAAELGIAPNSKAPAPKAPSPATPKPQAVQQTAVRRANPQSPVASAGDRTTTAGPTTSPFGNIRNANEYAEAVRKLGASV